MDNQPLIDYQNKLDKTFTSAALHPRSRIEEIQKFQASLKRENATIDSDMEAYSEASQTFDSSGRVCDQMRQSLIAENNRINMQLPRYKVNFHMIERCDDLLTKLGAQSGSPIATTRSPSQAQAPSPA